MKGGQTKWDSVKEALTNIAIGYTINFWVNWFTLPAVGLPVTVGQNLLIGLIFTVISVLRTYVLRRVFNAWMLKKQARAA